MSDRQSAELVWMLLITLCSGSPSHLQPGRTTRSQTGVRDCMSEDGCTERMEEHVSKSLRKQLFLEFSSMFLSFFFFHESHL